MQLTHEFTVPASMAETWEALGDVESVGGCFPGATVTSVEGDTFAGSCKVKLGPIALVYTGTGRFVDRDESARTMRIEAKGKDKRGNGTAGADVTVTLAGADGDEPGTTVTVVTDLAITGKPAQFGRGVMQDVSDKLLGQFVECLRTKVGAREATAEAEEAAETAETGETVETGEPAVSAAAPAAPAAPPPVSRPAAREDDSLDLGSALLPVLVRLYGRQAAAVLGLLLALVLLRRLLR